MEQNPVLNHVALTVDRELLQGPKRQALKDFYGSVFGWEEIPQLTNDGRRLVFRLYRRGQFLYLISGSRPSSLERADHFGIEVRDKASLEQMIGRAKQFKQTKDAAVEIIDIKHDTDTPQLRLWNAYVRYLLPLMVEVQYYEEKVPAATQAGAMAARVASARS